MPKVRSTVVHSPERMRLAWPTFGLLVIFARHTRSSFESASVHLPELPTRLTWFAIFIVAMSSFRMSLSFGHASHG